MGVAESDIQNRIPKPDSKTGFQNLIPKLGNPDWETRIVGFSGDFEKAGFLRVSPAEKRGV